mgnify:CR=1 FL=1
MVIKLKPRLQAAASNVLSELAGEDKIHFNDLLLYLGARMALGPSNSR